MTIFYVLNIQTGKVKYDGPSQLKTAMALLPGTCYERGKSYEDAYWNAKIARHNFLNKRYDGQKYKDLKPLR